MNTKVTTLTNSINGVANNKPMIYRGNITGDLNRLDITPGYYCIGAPGTISHGILPSNKDSWCQFIQWGDGYRTQYIVDGSGLHRRSYVGSPSAWTKWDHVSNYGNGTLNSNALKIESTSKVTWNKNGLVCTVSIYDLVCKGGLNTNNNAASILATGLPPAGYGGVTFTTVGLIKNDKTATRQVRLNIDASGQLKLWYIGNTDDNLSLSDTFVYIMDHTKSGEWDISKE